MTAIARFTVRPRKTAFRGGDRLRSLRRPLLLMTAARRDRLVLVTISILIPASGDVDGHASGLLCVGQIAEAAKISRNNVRRSLMYFRAMRVLWLAYREGRVEVRFERRLVKELLWAFCNAPEKITPLLSAHRLQREAIAPYRRLRPDSARGNAVEGTGTRCAGR